MENISISNYLKYWDGSTAVFFSLDGAKIVLIKTQDMGWNISTKR